MNVPDVVEPRDVQNDGGGGDDGSLAWVARRSGLKPDRKWKWENLRADLSVFQS